MQDRRLLAAVSGTPYVYCRGEEDGISLARPSFEIGTGKLGVILVWAHFDHESSLAEY